MTDILTQLAYTLEEAANHTEAKDVFRHQNEVYLTVDNVQYVIRAEVCNA